LPGGGYQWEGGREMERVNIHENWIMKTAAFVLRRGGRMRENNGEINLIKIHYKHICKYHNETPLYK
jgi:hypothetical protein